MSLTRLPQGVIDEVWDRMTCVDKCNLRRTCVWGAQVADTLSTAVKFAELIVSDTPIPLGRPDMSLLMRLVKLESVAISIQVFPDVMHWSTVSDDILTLLFHQRLPDVLQELWLSTGGSTDGGSGLLRLAINQPGREPEPYVSKVTQLRHARRRRSPCNLSTDVSQSDLCGCPAGRALLHWARLPASAGALVSPMRDARYFHAPSAGPHSTHTGTFAPWIWRASRIFRLQNALPLPRRTLTVSALPTQLEVNIIDTASLSSISELRGLRSLCVGVEHSSNGGRSTIYRAWLSLEHLTSCTISTASEGGWRAE